MTIRKSIGCRFKVYASLVWKSLSNIAGFYLPSRAIRKLCEPSYFFVIKYMAAAVNSMCTSSSLRVTEAVLYRLPWPRVRRSVNPWQGHYRSTSVWVYSPLNYICPVRNHHCYPHDKRYWMSSTYQMLSQENVLILELVRGCSVLASAFIDWTIIGFYSQINLYEGKTVF